MTEFFQKTFLFKGVDASVTERLISKCKYELTAYSKGDEIYSPSSFDRKIGFVLEGKCAVCRKRSESDDVILNVLEKYSSFGVLAAFSTEEFPTVIRATKDCRVIFISKQEVLDMISDSPEVAINIIDFLAGRISFLNKRISTFTCTTVENKLASFILSEHARLASLEIPFNCKRVANAINVGRASIYRALESLSGEGAIIYDTKKISIKRLDVLERMSK